MNMYAIYDKKVDSYLTPFFAEDDKFAKRIVVNSLSAQSAFVQYPSDYVLCFIALVDLSSGSIRQEHDAEGISLVKDLIPVALKKYALDGTFERSAKDEEKAKEN